MQVYEASPSVPTVNDLRVSWFHTSPHSWQLICAFLQVKLCYICREEERFDVPDVPPKAWTHPCNCTLVAHETCLLQWIQTSQASPTKANALNCPQCGAQYEITSNQPPMYHFLVRGNRLLSRFALLVTAAGLTSVVVTIGTGNPSNLSLKYIIDDCEGLYVVSTAYGMYAVREFIGRE